MKTLLKITAISLITAAITAFMVISCAPPELPGPHNDWWDEYSEQFDASRFTDNTGAIGTPTVLNFSLEVGDTKENTITITFPNIADILKKDTIETADISAFLSFYTFNTTAAKQAAAAATPAAPNTTPTVLNPLTGWSLDKRLGNDFILKMPVFTADSSNLVCKIDSSKYTHSGGIKIDRDGNGIAGEPGYDDLYGVLNVTGITDSSVSPVLPQNRGWYVRLEDILFTTPGTTDTTTTSDQALAYINSFDGISDADKEAIIKTLVPGFKVESFSDGVWSTASFLTVYDDTYLYSRIRAKDFFATHNTAYRSVFEKGNISLETEKEFYGLKQRFSIEYGTKSVSNSVLIKNTRLEGTARTYYNNTKRAYKNLFEYVMVSPGTGHMQSPGTGHWTNPGHYDYTTQTNASDGQWYTDEDGSALVVGDPDRLNDTFGQWYNTGGEKIDGPGDTSSGDYFVQVIPTYLWVENQGWVPDPDVWVDDPDVEVYATTISIYSHDSLNENIVLKLVFNGYATVTTPTATPSITRHYLKQLDLATFKENFKIYASNSSLSYVSNPAEIGIKSIEFKQENIVPAVITTYNVSGYNVIYITLDPGYRQSSTTKRLYVGSGFGLTDGVTVFSNSNELINKGFKEYAVPYAQTF